MNENIELKNKAIELRTKNNMSLNDIVDIVGIPKTTVYYWIKKYKLDKIYWKKNHLSASNTNRLKYQKLRDEAYDEGKRLFEKYKNNKTFRDFIVLFLTEGNRKNFNGVCICNSNECVIIVSLYWFRIFSNNKITFNLQLHSDDNINECSNYWKEVLKLDKEVIKVCINDRVSPENKKRHNKLKYGTFSIRTSDTYFRFKMQYWMDVINKEWEIMEFSGIE